MYGDTEGICGIKCDDLCDDDLTDDVKCVKQVIKVKGYEAWFRSKECLLKSKDIIKECFENVLDNTCIINAVTDITSKLPHGLISILNNE